MSKSIDKRIVEMEFDNKQFEREVKVTKNTLDRLKELLNFDDQAKSLSGISKAAKDVDMSSVADNVESLASRFSTMGIVGMTVIEELTRSVMNLGKKLLDVSIGQVISGGKSRALNLEQAAFRFKGIGVDVEKAMESANKSVLGTMYGFDAAANAGSQLAASGVDVGDSLYKALRGTAGLAAMTGSEFEDISNIMVTVAGQGRLMGDQLNRFSYRGLNVAATLATQLGTSEENVRDMVSKGQVSFDMFSEAMYEAFGEHATGASELFSGAMAHAKAALSRIGGTFAPAIFNNMRDVLLQLRHTIDGFHDILKPYLPAFEDFANTAGQLMVSFLKDIDWTPMTSVVDGLVNILKALWSWVKPIGQAFRDVFPKSTVDNIQKITDRFRDFTKGLILSDKASNNVRKTFSGLFSILKIVADGIKILFNAVFVGIGGFKGLGDVLLVVTGFVGGLITKLLSFINITKAAEVISLVLGKAFESLGRVIKPVRDILERVTGFIADTVVRVWKRFRDEILANIDPMRILRGVVEALERSFKFLGDILKPVFDTIQKVTIFVRDVAISAWSKFNEKVIQSRGPIQFFKDALDGLKSILRQIYDFFAPIIELLKEFAIYVGQEFIMPGWEKFKEIVVEVWEILVLAKDDIVAAFGEVQAGAAEKLGKAGESATELGDKVGGVRNRIIELGDSIKDYLSPIIDRLKEVWKDVTLTDLFGVGVVGWLLFQIKKLVDSFKVEQTTISDVLEGVVGVLGEAQNTLKTYQKDIKANTLLKIAGSIAILVGAIVLIGMMDGAAIAKGLGTIALLFAQLAIMMKIVDKLDLKKIEGATSTILTLSVGLLMLAGAIYVYSKMEFEEIKEGLAMIGLLLAGLAIAIKIMDGANLKGVAASLMAIAIGLTLLSVPLLIFGKMDTDTLNQGLEVMIVLLMGMVGAMVAFGLANKAGGGYQGIALGLIAMATAMMIIAKPIKELGQLSWEELIRGLVGVLAPLLAFAGMAVLLAPTAPVLVALAASLLLLGAAIALMGTGMSLYIAALIKLADVTEEQMTNIVNNLEILILAALETIKESIPLMIDILVIFLLEAFEGLKKVVPALIETIIVILSELIIVIFNWLRDYGGPFLKKLWDALSDWLIEIRDMIVDKIKEWAQAVADFFVEWGDRIKQGARDMWEKFITGMQEKKKAIMDKVSQIVGDAVESVRNFFSNIRNRAKELIDKFREGVGEKAQSVIDAITKIPTDSIAALFAFIRRMRDRAKEIIQGFIDGVTDKEKSFVDNVKALPKEAIKAIGLFVSDFTTAGKDLIMGFVNGIANNVTKVANAARNVASNALRSVKDRLGIASPSKEFEDIASDSALGLIKGFVDNTKKVSKSAETVATTALESLGSALSSWDSDFETDLNLQPRIRPVVDLDEVRNAIDNYFNQQKSLNLDSIDAGLVDSIKEKMKLFLDHQNGSENVDTGGMTVTEKHYHLNLQALGQLPKHVIEQMAEDFDEAIKGLEDRDRINRGEDVVF